MDKKKAKIILFIHIFFFIFLLTYIIINKNKEIPLFIIIIGQIILMLNQYFVYKKIN